MSNMKKALIVVGAMMALVAQAQEQDLAAKRMYPDEPAGAAKDYKQFKSDLGVLCGAPQPFTAPGEPFWTCTGGVDQGITVGPRPAPAPAPAPV